MTGHRERKTPRAAFGCMAVAIIALVVAAAFAVVFLWDVNAH
jgi:hypothetical protein